ncbi:DUF3679 domain-containing protein [Fictibacillus aquaticus]|uniref:DUF3679 domain-containing protein n=1 Tax=Fictibacillus aquaticus TaxID=2021314 RepID=A0A235F9M0_9BACL|nr:DUF3679 domain-containing protein [Fictibacillus aquaticus]OYD57968.1 hypothetical protein CGZ90_08745 [Fictibacillus aquaticus]
MAKFMLKSLLLGVLLFLGILFGMQKAHDEMREMKGTDGKQTIEAPLFEKHTEVEASSPSGEPQFETEKKQLQQEKSFNFFSFLGQKATALVTVFFQAIISAVSFVIEELIGLLSL